MNCLESTLGTNFNLICIGLKLFVVIWVCPLLIDLQLLQTSWYINIIHISLKKIHMGLMHLHKRIGIVILIIVIHHLQSLDDL